MLIAWLPLIVALIGLLVYVLATHAKVCELARILFFVGAFFTVWGLAGETVRFGSSHSERGR